MIEKKVTIQSAEGLHARPASQLAGKAQGFKSETLLVHGEKEINAKSIMHILSGGITGGIDITVRCNGDDEAEALEAIVNFVETISG